MKPANYLLGALLASASAVNASGCLPLTVEPVQHLLDIPPSKYARLPNTLPQDFSRVRFGNSAIVDIPTWGGTLPPLLLASADGQTCSALFQLPLSGAIYSVKTQDGGQNLRLYEHYSQSSRHGEPNLRGQQNATVWWSGRKDMQQTHGHFMLTQHIVSPSRPDAVKNDMQETHLTRILESLDYGQTWQVQPGSFGWRSERLGGKDHWVIQSAEIKGQARPPETFIDHYGAATFSQALIHTSCFLLPRERHSLRREDIRLTAIPRQDLAPCPLNGTDSPS